MFIVYYNCILYIVEDDIFTTAYFIKPVYISVIESKDGVEKSEKKTGSFTSTGGETKKRFVYLYSLNYFASV